MIARIISVSKQLKLISVIILTIVITSCAPQQRETYTGLNIDVKNQFRLLYFYQSLIRKHEPYQQA